MTDFTDKLEQTARRVEILEGLMRETLRRLERLEERALLVPAPPAQATPAAPRGPAAPPSPVPPASPVPPSPPVPPVSAPPPAAPVTPPRPPVPPVPARPRVALITPSPPPPRARSAVDWETIVGGRWALVVGVILVLFAASFGLAYGWRFLGPEGRVAVGMLLGLVFITAGELSGPRAKRWFQEGLTACGVATLYLCVWAAAISYELLPLSASFVLMAIVTASGVALAIRHDALSLMLLATAGGFLSPILMRSAGAGAGDWVGFWGYLTVLNAGVLGAATFKRWRVVNLVVFALAATLLSGWMLESYEQHMRWGIMAFLTVNFVLFMGIGSAYPLRFRTSTEAADLAFFFVLAAAYFGAAMAVLGGELSGARGTFSLVLAACYGGLGALCVRRIPQDRGMASTAFALAIGFLTVAMPLLLRGHPLPVAWAAEAAALTFVGRRIRRPGFCSVGVAVWALALAASAPVWVDDDVWWPALLNPRFATLILVAAATALMAYLHHAQAAAAPASRNVADALAVAAFLLTLASAGRELYEAFERGRWFGADFAPAAWLSVMALAAVMGAATQLIAAKAGLENLRATGASAVFLAALAGALFSVHAVGCGWLPFVNLRVLVALLVAGALVASAHLLGRSDARGDRPAAAFMGVTTVLYLVTALSVEVYAAFLETQQIAMPTTWHLAAWLSMCCLWAGAGLLSAWLGFRWGREELRWVGGALWPAAALAGLGAALDARTDQWLPFVSFRGLALGVLIAVGVLMALLCARRRREMSEAEAGLKPAATLTFAAIFLGLWLLTQETHHLARWLAQNRLPVWSHAAQLSVSLVWTLYGAGALGAGIVRRSRGVRLFGLGLLGCAVLKVFLADLGFLDLPFRMLSFGVLGGILIAVAWLYSKYGEWLRS